MPEIVSEDQHQRSSGGVDREEPEPSAQESRQGGAPDISLVPDPLSDPDVQAQLEEFDVDGPRVGIVMGSKSDKETMEQAARELEERGIPHEVRVMSAHREPDVVAERGQLGPQDLRQIDLDEDLVLKVQASIKLVPSLILPCEAIHAAMPAATVRTSTSVGLITGRGTSSTSTGPPLTGWTTCFMVTLPRARRPRRGSR